MGGLTSIFKNNFDFWILLKHNMFVNSVFFGSRCILCTYIVSWLEINIFGITKRLVSYEELSKFPSGSHSPEPRPHGPAGHFNNYNLAPLRWSSGNLYLIYYRHLNFSFIQNYIYSFVFQPTFGQRDKIHSHILSHSSRLNFWRFEHNNF